ncbi:gamma-glutamylcyclotransferase [Chloroflexi bacterium TSY]|nr:gamma-glutamylcyclotransferase [Chloroflexi bacterium TSY]
MTIRIFVYGTLRPPQHHIPTVDTRFHVNIAQYLIEHVPAVLPNAVLYDLGSYPAAIPGDQTIHGTLLTLKMEALTITDRIEGHPTFYQRSLVTVNTKRESVEAWVYWAPQAIVQDRPLIQSGDWFRREQITYDLGRNRSTLSHSENSSNGVLRQIIERIARTDCSWMSTVRPDGRAHSAPVWHVWHQGCAYVVAQPIAVKVKNLAQNPSVVLTLPDPHDVVIVEGWAIETPTKRSLLQPLFLEKYQWDIGVDASYTSIIEITPLKLIAWGTEGADGARRWGGDEIHAIYDS